jgi:23S rRNA pseudouridine1911/1915/1917 synthase
VLAFARQALHAARLELAHPASGRSIAFESDPPADFRGLADALRARAQEHARA